MATTARGTAIHNAIQGGTYAAPPTGNHKVILAVLVARAVCTPAGAYAGAKAQADVEQLLAVPDPVTEILVSIAKVVHG